MILQDNLIILRAPEPCDIGFLYRLENDTSLWPVSSNIEPYSKKQLEKYIEESSHDLLFRRQVRFIICRKANSVAVGTADLTDIDMLHKRAEIGLAIQQEHQGNGYSSHALDLLEEYSKKFLRLHELHSIILRSNIVCTNLFVSHNYTEAGILKDWVWTCDTYSDAVFFQKILKKNQ